jgi:hypothetical protein
MMMYAANNLLKLTKNAFENRRNENQKPRVSLTHRNSARIKNSFRNETFFSSLAQKSQRNVEGEEIPNK